MTIANDAERRVRDLFDPLAAELLEFWAGDRDDLLALPDEALYRLAADYLMQRDYYRNRAA